MDLDLDMDFETSDTDDIAESEVSDTQIEALSEDIIGADNMSSETDDSHYHATSLSADELSTIEELWDTSSDIDHARESYAATPLSEEMLSTIDELWDSSSNIDIAREPDAATPLSEETMSTIDEFWDDEAPLTRTLEGQEESRTRDTEEVLENYRENLQAYDVPNNMIEQFIDGEREKINREYDQLDEHVEYPEMYQQPNNWEEIASSLKDSAIQQQLWNEFQHGITDASPENDIADDIEILIDYDGIYGGMDHETLAESFDSINLETNPERLTEVLDGFSETNWRELSTNERRENMTDLAEYISDAIGFDNPPTIEYYDNHRRGDYGGYDAESNTLHVNEYNLNDSIEAADTIAHELWHAHQYECSRNPYTERDYQYQYNFENYISPSMGFREYEEQLVEAEARAFASQIKDRLTAEGRMH